jgi:hypothetical protein
LGNTSSVISEASLLRIIYLFPLIGYGGRLFDLDIGRHTHVLDDKAVLGPDGQVGRRHVTPVMRIENRRIVGQNEAFASPRSPYAIDLKSDI